MRGGSRPRMESTGLFIELLNSLGFQRDDAHQWGYQLRCLNTSLYAAKFLVLTNSLPGSLHTHKNEKAESFICLAGCVWVDLPDSYGVVLYPGDTVNIPFNTRHRTEALQCPAVLLEISTHDDDEFTYRLSGDSQ